MDAYNYHLKGTTVATVLQQDNKINAIIGIVK